MMPMQNMPSQQANIAVNPLTAFASLGSMGKNINVICTFSR